MEFRQGVFGEALLKNIIPKSIVFFKEPRVELKVFILIVGEVNCS